MAGIVLTWLERGLIAGIFGAVLILIGTVAAEGLLRVRGTAPEPIRQTATVSVARAAWLISGVLWFALLARLVVHTLTVFPFPEGLSIDALLTVGLRSRWGGRWQVLLVLVTALLACAWHAARRPRAATAFARDGIIVLLTLALPRLGHANGDAWRLAAMTAHLLAGGVWLGALAVYVIGRDARAQPLLLQGQVWHRFAWLAIPAAAVVVLSGVVALLRIVETPSALWPSTYGALLLCKGVAVAALGLCGWRNWRSGPEHGLGVPRLELALAVTVVLLTAWLTDTAHP